MGLQPVRVPQPSLLDADGATRLRAASRLTFRPGGSQHSSGTARSWRQPKINNFSALAVYYVPPPWLLVGKSADCWTGKHTQNRSRS
jgi:hypothetical protein